MYCRYSSTIVCNDSRRYIDRETGEKKSDFLARQEYNFMDIFKVSGGLEPDEMSPYKLKSYISGQYKAINQTADISARLWSTGKLDTSVIYKPYPQIHIVHSAQLQLRNPSPDAINMGIGFLVNI